MTQASRTAKIGFTLLALAVAGCQGAPGSSGGLSYEPSDPCGQQRAAFASSKTYFQNQIVAGAATGAAIGAVGGLLAGLASGSHNAGTLIGTTLGGAVVGGAVGAGSAYYNTLWQRAQDQAEVANAMNSDLMREGQEIDHTTATFATLRQCRFQQAWYAKQMVRTGQIDRATALSRIAYNRDKFSEEIQTARQFGLSMQQRDQQFQEAANDLATKPPPASSSQSYGTRATPQRIAQVNQAASVSVPEKRQSFDSTIAKAEQSSRAAFDIDNNSNLSWLSQPGLDG